MIEVPNFDDEILSLLLRLRRFSAEVALDSPAINRDLDLPFYRVFWACSEEVLNLATYLVRQPHETAAVLSSVPHEHIGYIRGRLDASKTGFRQGVTGNSTLFVCHEAVRTFATTQNYLLIWVIEEARRIAKDFLKSSREDSNYFEQFSRSLALLDTASKNSYIKSAAAQLDIKQRPTVGSLTQSLRSRSRLYQLAASAYRTLLAIENGDEHKIRDLLNKNLLGPLEQWRKFELFTAVSVAESIARVVNKPCQLATSFMKDGCIAKIGHFSIFWQTTTNLFSPPKLEPSEQKTGEILHALGMKQGWDRPDLLIMDTVLNCIISVIEVKYFEGTENGKGPVRSAVDQIVRYARGYRKENEWDDLLTHSLIVPLYISSEPVIHSSSGVPSILDYRSVKNARHLDEWSKAVVVSKTFLPELRRVVPNQAST